MDTKPYSLVDLPVELISLILSFEVSHHVISLWKCGDKRLLQRLANGGASNVVLTDRAVNSGSRWPAMLVELRGLRSLTVNCGPRRIDDIAYIRKQLLRLSPALEELNLTFVGSMACLMHSKALELAHKRIEYVCDRVRKTYPPEDHCHKSIIRRVEYIDKSGMLALPFPALKRLSISGDCVLHFFRDLDLESLPRSLLSLEIKSDLNVTEAEWQRMDLLPPNLERLVIDGASWVFDPPWTKVALERLPQSLLEFGRLTDVGLCPYMPPNLRMMTNAQRSSITHQGAPFPPNLTSLSTNISRQELLTPYIPQNLTFLSIRFMWTFDEMLLKALPPTLTALEVTSSLNWNTVPSADIFPPNLTKLDLARDSEGTKRGLAPNELRKLPRQLLDLRLVLDSPKQYTDSLIDLPPNLTILELHPARQTQCILDGAVAAFLPRSLTSLDLHLLSRRRVKDFFDNLPIGLTSLSLGASLNTLDVVDSLANLSSLQSLRHLFILDSVIPSSAYQYLPRGLQTFHSDLRLPDPKVGVSLVDLNAVKALPPTLTHLCLENHVIPCPLLANLPRTLVALIDIVILNLTVDDFVDLPPRLRRLSCSIQNPLHTLREDEYNVILDNLPNTVSDVYFGPRSPLTLGFRLRCAERWQASLSRGLKYSFKNTLAPPPKKGMHQSSVGSLRPTNNPTKSTNDQDKCIVS